MRLRPSRGARPTESDEDPSLKVSRSERAIAFLTLFALVAFCGFGLLLGIGMSSPGPDPITPLGSWFVREGGYQSMGYWPYLHLLLGIVWLVGIPTWRRAARRYVGGTLTLGLAVMLASFARDLGPVTVVLFASGAVLILSALVYDRP